MVQLSVIKPYINKLAYLISTALGMDVLICNQDFGILVDYIAHGKTSEHDDYDLEAVHVDSVLRQAIINNEIVIYRNAKEENPGCRNCERYTTCDTKAVLAYPLEYEGEIIGGIDIYSGQSVNQTRLISEEKTMVEFVSAIGALIISKLKEEDSIATDIMTRAKEMMLPISEGSFRRIIGNSDKLSKVKNDARTFAKGNSNILILGESGTGKEMFANAIHKESPRSNGPFVAVNCAAIPDNLLESELFGYVGGAFTGASKHGRTGKFELADHGTLFLDEIGEMPIYIQPKILRAIQEKQIQRIGSDQTIDVDIRIISATNRNLTAMMETGEFREDLYYRLSVIPLLIPPLRERRSDIPDLVDYFLDMYGKQLGKVFITGLSKDAKNILRKYDWPGNVRELQNTIEYAVNRCNGYQIEATDLPERFLNSKKTAPRPLADIERYEIINAVAYFGFDKNGKEQAAKALGISRATLYRKLKKYGIDENYDG
jgi:transcriptional regulator with PAS, ATPase and Fis domain